MSAIVRGGLAFGRNTRTLLVRNADLTPPVAGVPVIDPSGTAIAIPYNEALATTTPANGDFAISGVTASVTGVSVGLTTVTLTVSPAIEGGAIVALSYTPGTNKIRDLALNNAAALVGVGCTNNSAVAVAPLYVSGTRIEFGTGQNVAYAGDDVNTITYRKDPGVTDPATGDRYDAWYSNGSPARLVICKIDGTTGVRTQSVATGINLPNSIADDHNTIHLGLIGSRLVVDFNGHSNKTILGMAPTAGATLVDSTWLLSFPSGGTPSAAGPIVAGNTTIESASTYGALASEPGGDLFRMFRSGGSGNGDNYLYKCSAAAVAALGAGASVAAMQACWTQQAFVLNGNGSSGGGCSFYYNDYIIEPSTGAHPGRHWLSFQARYGTNLNNSAGLWLIYSDASGADGTWKAWSDGSSIPSGAIDTQLTAAIVDATILKASVDPQFSNYYGNQGMCVGLDGVPNIAMMYGLQTDGVSLDGFKIYAWRCKNGAVTKRAMYAPTASTTRMGRPKPVWLDDLQRLVVFFNETDTSIDGTGRMTYVTAKGDALSNVTKGTIEVINGVNDIQDAQFIYDQRRWSCGAGTLEAFWMKCGFAGTTAPAVTPERLAISFSSISMPSDYTYSSVLGSSNVQYEFRGDQYVDDGSGKVQEILDLSGNVTGIVQATSGLRPTFVPNALGVYPAWQFDGTDDFITWVKSRAAPSASTVLLVYALIKQTSFLAGDRLWDLNGAIVFQTGSSPNLRMSHGTSGNQSNLGTMNTWKRIILQYAGSTGTTPTDAPSGDYIKIGSGAPVAGSTSNTTISGTSCTLGAQNGGGLPAAFQLAHFVAAVLPAAAARQKIFDLDGVTLKRYGATPLA